MARAWVALGGNAGDVASTMRAALEAMVACQILRPLVVSGLYKTAALTLPGARPQPPYLNAVVAGTSHLDASALVARLHALAFALGRKEAKTDDARWQPRTIDCDVVAVEAVIRSEPSCCLPHRGLPFRPFVLWPLADVAPSEVLQPFGCTAAALLAKLARPHAGMLAHSLSWRRPRFATFARPLP